MRNLAKRRSAAEWEEIVGRWRASGQSLSGYAKRHGLNPRTLSWWRTQIDHGRVRSRKTGARVSSAGRREGRDSKASFTEVRVTSAANRPRHIEVVTRSGYVLRVEGGVDPVALRSVLEAVEQC